MEDPGSKRPLTVHNAIINIAAAWEAIKPETNQLSLKPYKIVSRKQVSVITKLTSRWNKKNPVITKLTSRWKKKNPQYCRVLLDMLPLRTMLQPTKSVQSKILLKM
ncbi:hypothetical protein QE152_g30650 [Popillia japonica]|uniref:DDE-1 domain-containing protein n=1 Tax=Popillia japonica TaxID=7064 RepID=A0AAW1JDA3_POPJA